MIYFLTKALIITKKNLLILIRDPSKITSIFLYAFLDIILWGYSSAWVRESTGNNIVAISLLSGIIFWQFVQRSIWDVSLAVQEEVISGNTSSLISTPLKPKDYMLGIFIYSVLINIVTIFICYILALNAFGVSLIQVFGVNLFLFIFILYLFGISIGIINSSMSIYFGARFQTLFGIVGWLVAPLGGVFYQINVLPIWAQKLSGLLPLVYIFDAIRYFIKNKILDTNLIAKAMILNLLYLALAIFLLRKVFNLSRKKGLDRLIG